MAVVFPLALGLKKKKINGIKNTFAWGVLTKPDFWGW